MIAEKGNTTYKLNFSFVVLLTLMLILCEEEVVLICFTSSLLHETGHLLFMYIFSEAPSKVEFGAFGIRIERNNYKALSYKKEALVALGGIFVNFVIALFAFFYYYICGSNLAIRISLVNLMIAAVNSVPVNVLDMGRVVECLLLCRFSEEKVGKILGMISFIAVNLSAVFCLVYTFKIGLNVSLIAVTVYLYIVAIIKKWS